jgi:hypothetical protein
MSCHEVDLGPITGILEISGNASVVWSEPRQGTAGYPHLHPPTHPPTR